MPTHSPSRAGSFQILALVPLPLIPPGQAESLHKAQRPTPSHRLRLSTSQPSTGVPSIVRTKTPRTIPTHSAIRKKRPFASFFLSTRFKNPPKLLFASAKLKVPQFPPAPTPRKRFCLPPPLQKHISHPPARPKLLTPNQYSFRVAGLESLGVGGFACSLPPFFSLPSLFYLPPLVPFFKPPSPSEPLPLIGRRHKNPTPRSDP